MRARSSVHAFDSLKPTKLAMLPRKNLRYYKGLKAVLIQFTCLRVLIQ